MLEKIRNFFNPILSTKVYLKSYKQSTFQPLNSNATTYVLTLTERVERRYGKDLIRTYTDNIDVNYHYSIKDTEEQWNRFIEKEIPINK